jgi:hypothetical protein
MFILVILIWRWMIYGLMATRTSVILWLIFLMISGTLLQLSQYLHIVGLMIASFGCLILQEYTTRNQPTYGFWNLTLLSIVIDTGFGFGNWKFPKRFSWWYGKFGMIVCPQIHYISNSTWLLHWLVIAAKKRRKIFYIA